MTMDDIENVIIAISIYVISRLTYRETMNNFLNMIHYFELQDIRHGTNMCCIILWEFEEKLY